MKRFAIAALVSVLVLSVAGLLWAQGVLQTDMGSAQQVVKARKYLMHAVKLNVGDAAAKFEAGRIADIQANGAAIALAAKVAPPLYRETLESAYDGTGKYYKGAPPGDFEAASEAMRVAAQQVRTSAEKGDRDGVARAMGQLQESCGACHKPYRGSF